MKLVRVSSLYANYWKAFYQKQPHLFKSSFDEQRRAIHYDAFGLADNWKNALTPLGYEAFEIPSNIEPLQKAWARENNFSFDQNDWQRQITAAQIKKIKPEILFMFDYSSFGLDWLTEVRLSTPYVLGWCGAPFKDAEVFKGYDIVLSCIPELVEKFRKLGHTSEHMHHAFDPRVLKKIEPENSQIDLSFVGQIVRKNEYHLEREQILEALAEQIPLSIFAPGAEHPARDFLKTQVKRGFYLSLQSLKKMGFSDKIFAELPILKKVNSWTELPQPTISKKLRPYIHTPVFGLQMFQTLKNSKITLNSHIDISPHSASNLRLFEATGVGTCLLTDWKSNLNQLFEEDREIVSYKNHRECFEKAKWLLDHPKERKNIAEAGQKRCLKDHTFTKRAAQLNGIIRSLLEHGQRSVKYV